MHTIPPKIWPFLLEFGWYAIAVFFLKNALTLASTASTFTSRQRINTVLIPFQISAEPLCVRNVCDGLGVVESTGLQVGRVEEDAGEREREREREAGFMSKEI